MLIIWISRKNMGKRWFFSQWSFWIGASAFRPWDVTDCRRRLIRLVHGHRRLRKHQWIGSRENHRKPIHKTHKTIVVVCKHAGWSCYFFSLHQLWESRKRASKQPKIRTLHPVMGGHQSLSPKKPQAVGQLTGWLWNATTTISWQTMRLRGTARLRSRKLHCVHASIYGKIL